MSAQHDNSADSLVPVLIVDDDVKLAAWFASILSHSDMR